MNVEISTSFQPWKNTGTTKLKRLFSSHQIPSNFLSSIIVFSFLFSHNLLSSSFNLIFSPVLSALCFQMRKKFALTNVYSCLYQPFLFMTFSDENCVLDCFNWISELWCKLLVISYNIYIEYFRCLVFFFIHFNGMLVFLW